MFSSVCFTSQLAHLYFYEGSCTYVFVHFASNWSKTTCFTRSHFFAWARERKIIQKVLFLRRIVQVSVRHLRVLRCVLTLPARKPLFLRGILHVRYVLNVYRLLENNVFYEVFIFRLWRANSTSFKMLCFYEGSCISVCDTYVFYSDYFKHMVANVYFYKGSHPKIASNCWKHYVFYRVSLFGSMLPKRVHENVVFYSVSRKSFFLLHVDFALQKSICSKTTCFKRFSFFSARLGHGWTL